MSFALSRLRPQNFHDEQRLVSSMIISIREKLASRFLLWSSRLIKSSEARTLERSTRSILVFFHGASPTHASRAHEIARQVQRRGYEVRLAARGPHAQQPREKSIGLCDVETLPLAIHSAETTLADHRSCDPALIERCVESERALLRRYQPDLIIHCMKPTASIAARLEGIDEVEVIAGYQLPGYQRPLQTLSVLTPRDQFAAYLKRKSRDLKKRDQYYLVADTPALYPVPVPHFAADGFHYVGPLLKRAGRKIERNRAPLPTVYLKDRDGILRADLLQRMASKEPMPYRFLVESAGPADACPNPYVQFVGDNPAGPPWQKIDIIAGDLDLKTLSEALAHGVFPIGLASALDRELQLDRLVELDLGLKIDPALFSYPVLVQTLGKLLSAFDKIDGHLQQFADHLRPYSEQDFVADWVDNYFTNQHTALRYDPAFLLAERDFLAQLDGTTPPALSTETLRDLLHQGVKKGMPHWRQGKELFFDRIDSWNWLYENEPRFFAADYRACDQRRRAFFAIDAKGTIQPTLGPQRYRMTYTYTLRADSAAAKKSLKIFVPYPLETERQAVQLVECFPKNMAEYLYGDIGFFYAYPCTLHSEALSFSYTCELQVDLQCSQNPAIAPSPCDQIDDTLGRLPELEQLLAETIETQAPQNKREFAWAFYQRLVQEKKFRKTKQPAMGPVASAAFLLNKKGGNCIHFSQTFIALCQMVGIPAREKCGALLGYPTGEKTYEYWSINEPLIGHTWAEIYLEEEGWIPVDFHSTAIGTAAITADNSTDHTLSQYIRRNAPAFNAYYFGHLDNQRLLYSNSAKTIPPCVGESDDGWEPIGGLQCTYRMQVECI